MSEGQVIDVIWIERNGKINPVTACAWMGKGWPWMEGLSQERVSFAEILRPGKLRGVFHLVEAE